MSKQLNRLMNVWRGRSPREQVMLAAMALVIVTIVGWYGVLQPLATGVEASRLRAGRSAAMLAELEAAARSGGPSPGAVAAEARQPLAAVVDTSAQATGLTVDRKREEPDGRLTIWLTGANPGVMMGWLTNLAQAHGISVTDLTASRLDGGLLEVQIALQRPAS